jgi:hypothetical protein
MTKILTVIPAKYEKVYGEDGEPYTVVVEEFRVEERELSPEESAIFEQERAEVNLQCMTLTGRSERDLLLTESDKLVVPDRWETYTEEQKQIVRDYRQALRDIPQQSGFPETIVWPEKPAI